MASDSKKIYLSSGNLIIDSIVNFKLQEMEQKGIKSRVEVFIPEELGITSFDITVMLGNLFDNAVNAAEKLEESKREIDFKMRYMKGILVIKISNCFEGTISYEGDEIITSNKDKVNHGIGLSNVKNAIKKYQGRLEIDHDENRFTVTAIIFPKRL